jgi:hypothetical protein
VLLPHTETLLQANDRLVMIASPEAREAMAPFVVSQPVASQAGVQTDPAETPS